MPRPRFILFRSRAAAPSPDAVLRALAAIPHVVVRPLPASWQIVDTASGHEIEVTMATGPLLAADLRALADAHWRDDPEGRAAIRAADARFEVRYPEGDAALNAMLLVEDALERLTGGFGYDLEFNRITLAAEGEHRVITQGPAQEAEDEELMSQIAAMSEADLDRELAEGGLDPERVRRDGVELAATMLKQRDIYAALEAARIEAEGTKAKAREPRASLEKRLAEVRDVRSIGGAVGWLLRDHGLAKLGDGELQAIVDELAKWG